MDQSYERGDPCGINNCPSRRFLRSTDGTLTCENGHQKQGLVEAVEDDETFTLLGETTRKKRERVEAVTKYPKGRALTNFYLLCYQVILRKQLWWLVHEKKLPAELEELVRALWEQRLNALADRASDDSEELFASSNTNMDTDADADADEDVDSGTKIHLQIRKFSTLPNMGESLSIIYLATYLLRIPVFLGDIIRWTKGAGLIFNGAVDALPKDMQEKVAAHVSRLLNEKRTITAEKLQPATWRLFMAYQQQLDMALPPLNLPLYLFRLLQEMALPLEVYPAVMKLADLLSYSFEYPNKPTVLHSDPTPELKLVALVVVVVKLFYPFDSLVRHPEGKDEPTVAVINWKLWLKTKEERDQVTEDSNLSYEAAEKMTENDVFHMPEERLDQYLDWFGKTWAAQLEEGSHKQTDTFAKEMFKMFPISSDERPARKTVVDENDLTMKRLNKVEAGLVVRGVHRTAPSRKKILRPGNKYQKYRRLDELEGVALEFYTAAADVAGLPLRKLVYGVVQAENRLEEWMAKNPTETEERGR